MSNTIKLKRGSGSDPGSSDLSVGEVALRTDNGKLFTKKDDGSVTQIGGGAGAIDDGAVTTAKIADGAVTVDKLDTSSVNASKLTIQSVTSEKIANSNVTTTKIADDAVTYEKIQNVSATNRILGRDSSGAGIIEEITPANLRTMINVEDGATADQSNSEIKTAYEANSNTNAFTDALLSKLNGIAASATNVTNNNQLTNGAGYITATLTNEQVQDIVGGMVSSNTESGITVTYQDSDGTLDFSVASQTDENFTTTLKNKLDGIAASATNVTNNNQLTNGAGYITATLTNEQVQDIVGGMVSGNTESGITVTYQDSDGTLDFSVASQTDQNFTTTLKNKLDGIAAGATNVTNNNQLTNGAGYTTFSGSYNDLSNKPTIPTNNNQLSNGAGYITSVSGQNYNSLSNKPTIPTNNNQLSNGAGYITSVSGQNYNSLSNLPTIPTNNNQLSNGAGYATASDFPSFSVRLSSGQTINSGTYTKVNFNSEDWDTHSAHSNGRFTCPSGKAGKYFFNGFFSVDDIKERDRNQFLFYKNGSNSNFGFGYHRLVDQNNNQIITTHMSAIIDLAVGDYVEMYGFHNDGSTQQIEHTQGLTLFQGFRIVAS